MARGQNAASSPEEIRLTWFKVHLLLYGIVVAALALVNLFWLTGELWFVLFMVGWGAPIAGHCAWAMGFFRRGIRD